VRACLLSSASEQQRRRADGPKRATAFSSVNTGQMSKLDDPGMEESQRKDEEQQSKTKRGLRNEKKMREKWRKKVEERKQREASCLFESK
jgi:hypothetical protein